MGNLTAGRSGLVLRHSGLVDVRMLGVANIHRVRLGVEAAPARQTKHGEYGIDGVCVCVGG